MKLDDTPETVSQKLKAAKKKARDNKQKTYFVIGQSSVWDKTISVLIRRLIKKYNLTWLRHETVYHRFQNLTEMFQGDLAGKLMDGIVDLEG